MIPRLALHEPHPHENRSAIDHDEGKNHPEAAVLVHRKSDEHEKPSDYRDSAMAIHGATLASRPSCARGEVT